MKRFMISSLLLCAIGLATTLGQETDVTTGNVDKLTIAQFIDDVAAEAKNGVAASALRVSMEKLSQMVDSYLNDRNAKVPAQDIADVLTQITTQSSWLITLSTFLEDPLVQEGRKVSAGLFVLTELSKRIKTTTDETQLNVLIAAASFSAEAMRRSIANAETIYTYTNEDVEKTTAKRWEVYGSVTHSNPGGTSVQVGVSHKWKRSILAARQWTVGGQVGYGPGGWSGGVSLGYKWG